jgi:hypothetical protein
MVYFCPVNIKSNHKMKKPFLILVFLALMTTSYAQITLEHTYPASSTLTELSVSGYKYYLMDVPNSQCRIYNTDHSLWKTIAVTIPNGMYLSNIQYVSDSLFNKDSKVELAYTYYSYDTTLLYFTYYTKVIDEDGIELLAIPGCSFVDIIATGSVGTKLLAYVYDYSLLPYTINTLVYSLPGNLPPGGISVEGEVFLKKAYPNPAGSMVKIPYQLPQGINDAQILLINGSGQILKSYRVDLTFHELIIQTGDLPKGVLLYQLKTDQGIIGSGKLIHD